MSLFSRYSRKTALYSLSSTTAYIGYLSILSAYSWNSSSDISVVLLKWSGLLLKVSVRMFSVPLL